MIEWNGGLEDVMYFCMRFGIEKNWYGIKLYVCRERTVMDMCGVWMVWELCGLGCSHVAFILRPDGIRVYQCGNGL